MNEMDNFVAIAAAGDAEVRARALTAGLAIREVRVREDEARPLPCAGVRLADRRGGLTRIEIAVILQRPRIQPTVKVGDCQGDRPVHLVEIGIIDVEGHVGIAGRFVGAAGVAALRGVAHSPEGHGSSARCGVILIEPELEVAILRIPVVLGLAQRRPHARRIVDAAAQVVAGEQDHVPAHGICDLVVIEQDEVRVLG